MYQRAASILNQGNEIHFIIEVRPLSMTMFKFTATPLSVVRQYTCWLSSQNKCRFPLNNVFSERCIVGSQAMEQALNPSAIFQDGSGWLGKPGSHAGRKDLW